MRILITGAAGMLGADVVAAVSAAGHDPVARSRGELDITDPDAVAASVDGAGVDAVINCAAWTDVDLAERSAEAAHAANRDGAANVARAAVAGGAWTVHVSSDYVFAGDKTTPYLESDPVAPISVYGRSKLAGERAVAQAAPDAHTIVRSSWLFGTGGPCFPATILRLAGERDELSVVDDQRGAPTFTAHLAPALVELATRRRASGLLHVAAGGDCTWFEFAQEIVAAAGALCHVRPTRTSAMARPAPRPAYSVLGTERPGEIPPLPGWREGLAEYMNAGVRPG
jgi:dTDP-4-dehydrorhamnose reductase